jgi:UDP:flavonoid glycosyltransferase YjiC (YdhE family)
MEEDWASYLDVLRTHTPKLFPDIAATIRTAISQFSPDVVAVDAEPTVSWPTAIECARRDLPHLGISTNLSPLMPAEAADDPASLRAWRAKQAGEFRSFASALGIRSSVQAFPHGLVFFTTRHFVGDVESTAAEPHLVGPVRCPDLLVSFPWQKLSSDKPIILASFGSQIPCQRVQLIAVAQACAEMGAQFVANVGRLSLDADFISQIPDDSIAVEQVPQRKLLAHASVLVTHGGANSVMEALDAGVPMLLSPINGDQPAQAYFVARSGAGLRLDLKVFQSRECRQVLEMLLNPAAPFGERARRIRRSYRSADGAPSVAGILERLANGPSAE